MTSDSLFRPRDPAAIALDLQGRRAVFVGATGAGKSTLVGEIADHIDAARGICADPGSPGFGAPTTVSLATRRGATWHIDDFEAIASLDAGKYRMSILGAVDRLVEDVHDETLLIDAPGLYRGGIAREFVTQLLTVSRADVAVYVVGSNDDAELLDALRASGARVWRVEPSPDASRPSKTTRRRNRTDRWEASLRAGPSIRIRLDDVNAIGVVSSTALVGRAIGIGSPDGRFAAAGEVEGIDDGVLDVRATGELPDEIASILARDAGRGPDGLLRTIRDDAVPDEPGVVEVGRRTPFTLRDRSSAAQLSEPQTVRIGVFEASMLGGPFDDPSLFVSLLHHERGMLVDLGESWRLPTRLHHQLSDIFITHAHVDHFAGFVDVLRRRIHVPDPCRIWGPSGIARQVAAMADAFTWDRLEGRGPKFEITEVHAHELQTFRVEAGITSLEAIGVEPRREWLLDEPRFRVESAVLDHGTDSLAFRFEETQHYDVRSDRLEPPFEPGPWLGELKRLAAMDRDDDVLTMSDGSNHDIGELRDRLLLERPGQSIVYASDLADTPENRERLVELADGADLLICEAYFANEDRDKAEMAFHLTSNACGEIARDAGVGKLLPFHFSARYEDRPKLIYDEVSQVFGDLVLPKRMRSR
jgi:ribonuclease BN (tRNA processing enzyme)